jgi:alpha-glucoside transport system permease protein
VVSNRFVTVVLIVIAVFWMVPTFGLLVASLRPADAHAESGWWTKLLEAARVNGASEMGVFRKVVLPLGMPALAALTIFQFLWVWNDLLIALVFAGPAAEPLTVAIQQNLRQFGANFDIIAPAAFLSMVVPLAIFLAFQRYFVQGMLAGAAK